MRGLRVLPLLLGLCGCAAVVLAITYGFADTNNTYPNTGAFIVKVQKTGQIFPICSGTLIGPGVFLTAAHCVAFLESLPPAEYTAFVSFDNPIPFGEETSAATNLIPVSSAIKNPAYRPRQDDSGDIGVLLISPAYTAGIVPATLPPAGFLDQLNAKNGLRSAVFTAVGYGVQNRVNGGGPPYFQDRNPIPRMYSFSSFDALNPGYLRASQNPATGNGGACFGDSGGPNFVNWNGQRLIVATTVTGDTVCRATNVSYRLDTPSARGFLGAYVTLP